ncbi:NAD(P)-dependent oxidoreductase [Pseudoalteromonas flavipulchra]|uniref:NAD(P)-dependent oxidoreductase n=1 Tax=Pseudoalteromonas maricaloris TaxID=184924 RepID=A0A8I2KPQ6_9GAMM|nr:NAD(P)-dependent oxidoreductase [Pseudoalteromonas flavipulchra]NLR20992.1 NAD(P)-dependent oxidoreductase [Pseudoalteromonas maricaloris]RZG12037.1 NAD(P)-dependent oxidoreductase [Pseudoalteromonas sp. CO342X]
MRILVTGSAGRVGRAIYIKLKNNTDTHYNFHLCYGGCPRFNLCG